MANNNNNDERIRTSSSSTTPSGDGLLGSDAPPHQAQDLVAHSSMLDGYGGAAYQSTRPVADSPGTPFQWDQVDQLDRLNAEMCEAFGADVLSSSRRGNGAQVNSQHHRE